MPRQEGLVEVIPSWAFLLQCVYGDQPEISHLRFVVSTKAMFCDGDRSNTNNKNIIDWLHVLFIGIFKATHDIAARGEASTKLAAARLFQPSLYSLSRLEAKGGKDDRRGGEGRLANTSLKASGGDAQSMYEDMLKEKNLQDSEHQRVVPLSGKNTDLFLSLFDIKGRIPSLVGHCLL
jgi:hypothetical protein